MFKPIYEQNQLNIKNLVFFSRTIVRKSLTLLSILIILSFIFFVIAPSKYVSKVTFYTNYERSDGTAALSFLSNLTSLDSDNSLGFSLEDFLVSDRFLLEIVNKEYTINNNSLSLVDHWAEGINDFTLHPIILLSRLNKKLHFSDKLSNRDIMNYYAKKNLLENMNYSSNSQTGLHSVTIKAKNSPQLANDIAKNIYYSVVDYYTSITNIKALEKRQFISGRLTVVQDKLAKSEEDLVVFMEKNKSLNNSVKLMLKKDRIERDINLHNQLYVTLSSELEMAKIDEKNNTSTIYLLDSNISEFKAGENFFYSTLRLIIFYFFIVFSFNLIKLRKELFK
tara:strand:+ start:180 stop:1190 length:1011 start_codon:yes stop_codon:yes gene_type:complete